MDLLISPAFAQAAEGAPSPMAGFVPIILLFLIFYFLIIRPQNQKMKKHRELVASTKKGDEIVTGGGIYGKVTKVSPGDTPDATKVKVEIADGVEITISQNSISQVLTPRTEADKDKKAANDNK